MEVGARDKRHWRCAGGRGVDLKGCRRHREGVGVKKVSLVGGGAGRGRETHQRDIETRNHRERSQSNQLESCEKTTEEVQPGWGEYPSLKVGGTNRNAGTR
jgi:hypothetical protein